MLAIDRPGAEQKRVYPLAADLTVRGEARGRAARNCDR